MQKPAPDYEGKQLTVQPGMNTKLSPETPKDNSTFPDENGSSLQEHPFSVITESVRKSEHPCTNIREMDAIRNASSTVMSQQPEERKMNALTPCFENDAPNKTTEEDDLRQDIKMASPDRNSNRSSNSSDTKIRKVMNDSGTDMDMPEIQQLETSPSKHPEPVPIVLDPIDGHIPRSAQCEVPPMPAPYIQITQQTNEPTPVIFESATAPQPLP